MYTLSDIYIGNFPQTQSFGAREETYQARYGIKGHNGIDIGCPSMTPILATSDGWVKEIGSKELNTFDSGGYGTYIKVVHDGFFSLSAHLNDVSVKIGDKVVAGQLLGHSNNSGFSDGPHLHFGIAPCDEAGNKVEKNAYSGYINPNDASRCKWEIKNLTAPVVPGGQGAEQKISVPSTDFTNMVSQGSSFKVVVSYLKTIGLDKFLAERGKPQVNINHPDPLDGERVNMFLREMQHDIVELASRLPAPHVAPPSTVPSTEEILQTMPEQERVGLLKKVIESVRGFVLAKP